MGTSRWGDASTWSSPVFSRSEGNTGRGDASTWSSVGYSMSEGNIWTKFQLPAVISRSKPYLPARGVYGTGTGTLIQKKNFLDLPTASPGCPDERSYKGPIKGRFRDQVLDSHSPKGYSYKVCTDKKLQLNKILKTFILSQIIVNLAKNAFVNNFIF